MEDGVSVLCLVLSTVWGIILEESKWKHHYVTIFRLEVFFMEMNEGTRVDRGYMRE